MSTIGIDPRQGLHKNLDLLSAYNLYQKDWALHKPSRIYTQAINSPLFNRIQETLKDQSKAIDGARSHEISTRNIAVEAHVPVNELRTLLQAVQPQQAPFQCDGRGGNQELSPPTVVANRMYQIGGVEYRARYSPRHVLPRAMVMHAACK